MKNLVKLSLLLAALLAMAAALPATTDEESATKDNKDKDTKDDNSNENKHKDDESDDTKHGDKDDKDDKEKDDKDDNEKDRDDNVDDDADNVDDKDDEIIDKKKHRKNTSTSPIAKFSLKLLQSISKEYKKSFFMSPFSVWKTLTLLLPGSAGETKKQLMEALYGGEKETNYKKTGADLSHLHKVMYMMNKLYISKDYNLKKSTLKHILKDIKHDKKSFKGSKEEVLSELEDYIKPVDFSAKNEVKDMINKDVKDATKGAISEIIDSSSISSDTKMVLVNAIHFKGDWKQKFSKERTSKKDFHYTEGNEKKTGKIDMMTMMLKDVHFNVGKSKKLGCSIVELPYFTSGNKSLVSMYVFLPDEGNNVQDCMDKMTPKKLLKEFSKLKERAVYLELPKFKMEVKITDELMKGLKHQGITNIFDYEKADFSEFFDTKITGMAVSKIIHKAMIEIDEEGTTAAGATALMISTRSGIPNLKRFICNRPFIFMIYDNEYENPIFTGVFKNPNDVQAVAVGEKN